MVQEMVRVTGRRGGVMVKVVGIRRYMVRVRVAESVMMMMKSRRWWRRGNKVVGIRALVVVVVVVVHVRWRWRWRWKVRIPLEMVLAVW